MFLMHKEEAIKQTKDLAERLKQSSDPEVQIIATKLYTLLSSLAQLQAFIPVEISVEAGQINELEWLRAAALNPAFDFLKDSEEDIYTLADGKPFND